MKKLILPLLGIIFILPFFQSFGQNINQGALDAQNSILYDNFSKHLMYLASDELEGRDVGSTGYNKAALYVANEFKTTGLKPFGDADSYFQKVEFIHTFVDDSPVKFDITKESEVLKGIYAQDFTLLANSEFEKFEDSLKLVFVGYGHILPNKSINDYQDIDVKGKIVIAAMGGPKSVRFSEEEEIFMKIQNAKNKGAAGIILFLPKYGILQNKILAQIHHVLNTFALNYSDPDMTGEMFDFGIKLTVFAKMQFVEKILQLNGIKLSKEMKKMDACISVSKELQSELSVSYVSKRKNINCKNVVALLPGTDPVLKNEYVLVSAHLDHLGIGKPIKGDSIYNGMWDNASGSAAVLTIAKAFADLPEKPKRSILFICLTGEEKGLLGSNYFALRNQIIEGKIVADINLDMIGSMVEVSDIIPLGYSHSNLSEAVDFAAKELNMVVDDNNEEEKRYLERSDNISFMKQGIPSLFMYGGYTTVDPKINAKKVKDKWMKTIYHSPFDDMNQAFSEKAFLTDIKFNFLTIYYSANRLEEIKWNEESSLYKKYVLKE
jgi:hypothetical protein